MMDFEEVCEMKNTSYHYIAMKETIRQALATCKYVHLGIMNDGLSLRNNVGKQNHLSISLTHNRLHWPLASMSICKSSFWVWHH